MPPARQLRTAAAKRAGPASERWSSANRSAERVGEARGPRPTGRAPAARRRGSRRARPAPAPGARAGARARRPCARRPHQMRERRDVGAEHQPGGGQLACVVGGVGRRRHDEHRIARHRGAQALEDGARLGGVGRAGDQRERHARRPASREHRPERAAGDDATPRNAPGNGAWTNVRQRRAIRVATLVIANPRGPLTRSSPGGSDADPAPPRRTHRHGRGPRGRDRAARSAATRSTSRGRTARDRACRRRSRRSCTTSARPGPISPFARGRRGDGPGHLGALERDPPPAVHARGVARASRPGQAPRRPRSRAPEGRPRTPVRPEAAHPRRLAPPSGLTCWSTPAPAGGPRHPRLDYPGLTGSSWTNPKRPRWRRPRRAPAPSPASGGLAPSRAHGSSNSTRQRPSSVCISASRARNERPERPLKPVTGLLGAPAGDQLARDGGRQGLARLGLPDHEPAARILARPAGEALAVLDDVVAADRARPEVGARDAHLLELRVELETVEPANFAMSAMKRSRSSSPCSIRPSRCSQSPVIDGEVRAWSCEQADHVQALLGGDQRAAVALDVADVDQALDDRRARGRGADPGLLHRLAHLVVVDELACGLHRAQQRGVGVAPRRLGDLLLGADLARVDGPRPARAWAAAGRRPRRRRRRCSSSPPSP